MDENERRLSHAAIAWGIGMRALRDAMPGIKAISPEIHRKMLEAIQAAERADQALYEALPES